MRSIRFQLAVLSGALFFMSPSVWAAHPLITDDTGTQGKGKFQLEVNGEYDHDQEGGVKTTGGQAATTLSYGIIDNIDVILGLPYAWNKIQAGGVTLADEKGISDSLIEIKWRFYDKDRLSIALKPGLSLPTGDENKGLGTGKTGYHLFLIGSLETAPWAFHANLGYIRNESKFDEEENLWHVSLAATYEIVKDLKFVGNIGAERSREKTSDNDPAFALAGVIYSVNENFDLDFGLKGALTRSETDYAVLAGTTFRF
ncbi:MAG TPA: transporter [Nitrospirota bacterium]|nr:transporter [Nitrospirota bacterium]